MFDPVSLVRGSQGVDPMSVEYTVIDLETTGLHVKRGHRVCEIAAVRIRGDGTVLEEFSTLVNPQRPISRDNQVHHRVSNEAAALAPVFAEVAGTLLRLMRGAVVVAHNLAFEGRFLEAEFTQAGAPGLRVAGLCTLTAFRSHTDMPGYALSGVVKSLTGAWPEVEHAALPDARNTARVLSTLLATAPQPLSLTGAPGGELPLWPEAVRTRPRVTGLGKGEEGWLAHLRRALPRVNALPLNSEAAERYRSTVETLTQQGRLSGDDADHLAALASAAHHSQASLRDAHTDLWRAALRRADAPLAPRAVRDLTRLAQLLDVQHLAAGELPSVGDELKGLRIVPLGADPAVLALADWAQRHGATIGVRPSKTTSLVIAPEGTPIPNPDAVSEHRIPVLSPAAAESLLRDRLPAPATAPRPAPGSMPAGLDGDRPSVIEPGVGAVWRRCELPHELTAGKFTHAVRWLTEQAADPEIGFAQFVRHPVPTLTVNKARAPRGSDEMLTEAIRVLRDIPGLTVHAGGKGAQTPRATRRSAPPPAAQRSTSDTRPVTASDRGSQPGVAGNGRPQWALPSAAPDVAPPSGLLHRLKTLLRRP